jgi:uroporphyrinogen-III synthase
VSGERIVSTLSPGTLDGLERALDGLGVTLVHQPLLTFETDEFSAVLSEAVAGLDRFQAVALTSPRSAELYARAILEMQAVSPPVWCAGRGTGRALKRLERVQTAQSRGPDGAAEELARLMLAGGVTGSVLFPCGEQHRDALPSRLRDAGIEVTELVCYRAVIAPPAELRAAAASGDIIIVGSGRVAQALANAVPASTRPTLVAIGPITARAAAAAGWTAAGIAGEPAVSSLLQALRGVLALSHGVRQ